MRKHTKKQELKGEAILRAVSREKLISTMKQKDINVLYVGMKEKIKHGIVSKKDALEQISSWKNVSSSLVKWVHNYVPPKPKKATGGKKKQQRRRRKKNADS